MGLKVHWENGCSGGLRSVARLTEEQMNYATMVYRRQQSKSDLQEWLMIYYYGLAFRIRMEMTKAVIRESDAGERQLFMTEQSSEP